MCQKKLLRYRNSTCCLGFQPISYCQARMHGYHCMDPRIVGVKATNVDKPTSHVDVECNATLFCRMRVPSERVRFCKGDWDLVLPGLTVEPAGEVYKEVKKPVGVLRMPSCWRSAGAIPNWQHLPSYHDNLDRALGYEDTPEQILRDKFKSQVLVHVSDLAGSERGLLNWHQMPTPPADAEVSQPDAEEDCPPAETIWSHYEEITFAREASVEPSDAYGYFSITPQEIAIAREEVADAWEEMAAAREEVAAAQEAIVVAREGSVTSDDAFGYTEDEVEEEIVVQEETTVAGKHSVASSDASGHSSGDEEEEIREVSRGAGGKSSPGAIGEISSGVSRWASKEASPAVSEEVGDASDDSSELTELSDNDFSGLVPENIERFEDEETEDEDGPATPDPVDSESEYYDDEETEDEVGPATPGPIESESGDGSGTKKERKRSASEAELDEREGDRKHPITTQPEVEWTDDDEPLSYRWRKAEMDEREGGRKHSRTAEPEVEWTDEDEPLAHRKHSMRAEPEVETDEDEPLSYRWRK